MTQLAYTRNQIAIGTFIGGPLAGIYYLKKNFDAMGDAEQSKKTIIIGLSFVALLLALLPFLPEFIPSVAYAVGYAVTAQSIYTQKQTSLKDNPRYSNWNTAGVAVLSIVAFVAIIIPLIYVYYALGIIVD